MSKPITATSHPRLMRACQWVAILSTSEAVCTLIAKREGREYACEATAHFGGATHVVQRAFACRYVTRQPVSHTQGA